MKTDMSPHSVTMRLKQTSELRRLCIALGGERLKEKLRDGISGTGEISSHQGRGNTKCNKSGMNL